MHFHRPDEEQERACSSPAFTVLLYQPVKSAVEGSHPSTLSARIPLTMIPRLLVAAVCVLGPLNCAAHGGNINGEATYISFSVPGALGTYPMSINASMTVTGYYYVTPTVARGFLREADGTITTFNVGGAIWTQPEGINAAGDIAGFYELVAGTPRGFLRYADGRLITFDPPPSVEGMALQSQPISISDSDDIAGTYLYAWVNYGTSTYPPQPAVFARSRAGVFNTIPPQDTFGPGFSSFWATAINWSGAVVGYFTGDIPNRIRLCGALRWLLGPVRRSSDAVLRYRAGDYSRGYNAGGTIVGWYTNCNTENNIGGFVRSPDGDLTLFKPAGTILTSALPPVSPSPQAPPPYYESLTAPRVLSIDEAGDITGSYTDAAGVQHGFVRNPYGTITSFDPPEAIRPLRPASATEAQLPVSIITMRVADPPVGFIRVP
jgi:hypothetical protein